MNTLTKTNNQRGLMRPWFSDFFDTENFLNTRNWPSFFQRTTPAVNVSEDDKNFMVEVIAPGFKKEDFKISSDDDTLTISAETKSRSNEHDKEYSRQEYSCSSFTRSFNLPDNAKRDNIEASYSDGILHLQVPKTEVQARPTKTIHIK